MTIEPPSDIISRGNMQIVSKVDGTMSLEINVIVAVSIEFNIVVGLDGAIELYTVVKLDRITRNVIVTVKFNTTRIIKLHSILKGDL